MPAFWTVAFPSRKHKNVPHKHKSVMRILWPTAVPFLSARCMTNLTQLKDWSTLTELILKISHKRFIFAATCRISEVIGLELLPILLWPISGWALFADYLTLLYRVFWSAHVFFHAWFASCLLQNLSHFISRVKSCSWCYQVKNNQISKKNTILPSPDRIVLLHTVCVKLCSSPHRTLKEKSLNSDAGVMVMVCVCLSCFHTLSETLLQQAKLNSSSSGVESFISNRRRHPEPPHRKSQLSSSSHLYQIVLFHIRHPFNKTWGAAF